MHALPFQPKEVMDYPILGADKLEQQECKLRQRQIPESAKLRFESKLPNFFYPP